MSNFTFLKLLPGSALIVKIIDSVATSREIVTSVNGQFADVTGNVTVDTGGGASGIDSVLALDQQLTSNRSINVNGKNLSVVDGDRNYQDILPLIFQHFMRAGDGTNQAGLQLVGDSGEGGDTLCYLSAGNGVDYVFITLNFKTNTIKHDASEHQFEGDASITGKAAIGGGAAGVGTSNLKISGLQSFADNAAAVLGGLTTGDVYYTDDGSGNLHLMICNNPD